jgi:heme-degrading monooxygenase HmoA
MILRSWSARATAEGADRYVAYVRETLLAALGRVEGHRGAMVATREVGGEVEVTVLTLWESMAAIQRFAGPDPVAAVVEPEARALLTRFDAHVTHAEVRVAWRAAAEGETSG